MSRDDTKTTGGNGRPLPIDTEITDDLEDFDYDFDEDLEEEFEDEWNCARDFGGDDTFE